MLPSSCRHAAVASSPMVTRLVNQWRCCSKLVELHFSPLTKVNRSGVHAINYGVASTCQVPRPWLVGKADASSMIRRSEQELLLRTDGRTPTWAEAVGAVSYNVLGPYAPRRISRSYDLARRSCGKATVIQKRTKRTRKHAFAASVMGELVVAISAGR